MDNRVEHLRTVLRDVGRPVTSQRLCVWKALHAKHDHPTVAELHTRCGELPLATVYNTLDLFAQVGLVRPISLDGIVRYDINTSEHIHVVCTSCQRVRDVDLRLPSALEEWVQMESGYALSYARLTWYGLCPACIGSQKND